MLRAVFGYKREDKINMQRLRESISMFSVNQMNCYHVLLEAHNVVKNGSSNIIQEKWTHKSKQNEYCLKSKTNQETKGEMLGIQLLWSPIAQSATFRNQRNRHPKTI